jgi:UDP-N-acetylglucosamine diphosphorylase / glucose-1-phosphate thymidylyltransferase / UDP-N-acetylgalactosamine diphosphorylase / glucosamine-1-phosphate N-acetyltransferase / galactosamine-1-phosphate N-acetyltransferase
MKKIVFTEEFCQPENLFPFTLTRQIQDIRVGIFTIREKWEKALGMSSFDKFEEDYKDLDRAIKLDQSIGEDTIYLVHGNVLPTPKLLKQVKKLKAGEFISLEGKESVVYCITKAQVVEPHKIKVQKSINLKEPPVEVRYPWDLFQVNALAIALDFEWLKQQSKSARVSSTNKVTGSDIFIEKGATMEHCIINSTEGPVYIGKNAHVMEGSMLKGPLSIGDGSVVKMGTRIYGATTIGPGCVVGGEIKNSIIFGYSNKAHDGYLGDSIIGEWCNLGAGTSNSNIRNNASPVWVYTPNGPVNAGLKCGVMMGDFSRTAINTSINTGTVIGVSANVFGNGLTPKYIPCFSWGSEGIERYNFDKAIADIESWKSFKGQSLSDPDKNVLKHIFDNF